MKLLLLLLLLIVVVAYSYNSTKKLNPSSTTDVLKNNTERQSIHTFKVSDLQGNEFDFSTLKGNKIMVVNTASKCGLTPQYKGLQELYTKYKAQNFVIVGFPSNNFLRQEPGTDEEIAQFCQQNYGVSFPMMSKIAVKGKKIHPIYQFLTQKSKNGLKDNKVKWNFQKYLINENGFLEVVISPKTLPTDELIINWIENK